MSIKISILLLFVIISTWLLGNMIFGLYYDKYSLINYARYFPEIINGQGSYQNIALISLIGAFFCSVAIGRLFISTTENKIHGDAKFASSRDVKKSGLLDNNGGIVIGKYKGQYLTYGGSEHVLLSSPTRGGKGVGVVIPNLLNYNGSIVVLDIKKENYNITSGYRAKNGHKCFIFSPDSRDYTSHCWNPLHYLNKDPNLLIDDVQKIANMLWSDPDNGDTFWAAASRSMFLAIILHMHIKKQNMTLANALNISCNDDNYFEEALDFHKEKQGILEITCANALSDYIATSENTRTSIRKNFTSKLEMFYSPVLEAITSKNDFDLRELRRQKITIYLSITPNNLDRFAPIINLFFQQILDLNTEVLPEDDSTLIYSLLLLMDEFTAIGKISVMAKSISYIAGYGIRSLPIIQSPAQVVAVYGEHDAKTFFDNHSLQIVYTPKNIKIAEEISRELGNRSATVKSTSTSRESFYSKGKNASFSEQKRALMLPQELKELPFEKEIIVVSSMKPILADKILYFKDNVFINRLNSVNFDRNKRALEIPKITLEDRKPRKLNKDDIPIKTKTEDKTYDEIANMSDEELDELYPTTKIIAFVDNALQADGENPDTKDDKGNEIKIDLEDIIEA